MIPRSKATPRRRDACAALVVVVVASAFAVAFSAGSARGGRVDAAALVAVGDFPHQAVATVAFGPTGGRILRRYPVAGIRSLSWSPDWRSVAVVTAGTADTNILEIIDLSTGKRRLLANARRQSPAAFFGVVAWSPNGALLAVTRSANAYGAGIEVLDARTGTLSRQFAVAARHDSRLSWTPDGRSLLFAQQGTPRTRPTIRRLMLATGKLNTVSPTAGFDPAVSRGGVVAFAASDGVRVRLGQRDVLLHASRRGDRAPTWSSDGKQLLVERPARSCPRSFTGDICTQVLAMSAGGGSARRLLEVPARSPVRR